MLKLRTLLLSNYLYILILVLTVIISTIRITLPKTSKYSKTDQDLTGIVTKYSVNGNNLSMTLKGKEPVIINYYFKTKKELLLFRKDIKLGDKLYVTGEFKTPSSNTTDYLFNYKNYLRYKNIFYTMNITSYKKISSTQNILYLIKQKILDNLQSDPYLYTFILGDKSYLSTDVLNSYQENGISHLFAISGMHISLLSSIIIKILRKMKLSEIKSYCITSTVLLFYLLLVGLSPSILRGVLFFILFSLNKLYYFYVSKLNIFILTLSITLLINPFFIFDLGFIYSFIISLSLLINSKWLASTSYLLGILKVSFISFLVSIPISLYNFYQVNILSIIYNLFYVPLVSIVIFPLSIITSIIPKLLPIYNFMTNILETASIKLSHISITKLIFPRINIIIYILEFALIFIIFKMKRKKNKLYVIIIFLLILLAHYYYPNYKKQSYIKMIDVGQGDSILIHSNNDSILIDTGGKRSYKQENWQLSTKKTSIVKNTTIPLLKSLGIKKLKYLILTHGDYDHLGETINLIDNFQVDKIYINEGNINSLEKQIILKHNNVNIAYEGTNINIGDFYLYQLNSDLKDENDSSSIYFITNNNIKMLFMGDASVKSEDYIMENYELPEIDILKVGHHGSKTSSSKKFVNTIKPKYSLISCGKDNKFGHPNSSVLEILNDSNIYRTDKDGTVTFKIKDNKIKTETFIP